MRSVMTFVLVVLPLGMSAFGQVTTFEVFEGPIAAAKADFSLSRNGAVMACNYGGEIYLWTPDRGFVYLGSGHPLATSVGISADGFTVCATRSNDRDGHRNPALWSVIDGWVDLGHSPDGCVMDDSWGSVFDLSGDGSVAVGLSWVCPGAQGFMWTRGSGMVDLAHPGNGGASRASAVSADGLTIVGFFEHPEHGFRRPVRWLPDGTPDLYAGEEVSGAATDTNDDGSIIVGYSVRDKVSEANYWTEAESLVYLGTLTGHPYDPSVATHVTDDGTIYGHSGDPWWGITEAFVWTATDGMRRLQDVFAAAGADVPADLWLTDVAAVSGDGTRLVGSWRDRQFNRGQWMAAFEEGGPDAAQSPLPGDKQLLRSHPVTEQSAVDGRP